MVTWLVELGHTRIKRAAWSDGDGLSAAVAESPAAFGRWLDAARGHRLVLAGRSRPDVETALVDQLEARSLDWARIGLAEVALPVRPAYATLGVDRWLAINAAWAADARPLVVVDCGTATTLDVVDAGGVHRGGWILPGAEAARSGLLARAPALERPRRAGEPGLVPATDTAAALERGLVLQQAGAIRLGIDATERLLGGRPRRVVTGGGAATLQSVLDFDDVQPDLVLHGMALAVKRMDSER